MKKRFGFFFSSNHILFEFDDTIVVSRLIEGEYFRINQMLSSELRDEIFCKPERIFGLY